MNRELWFRILQVAVIAPYLYKLSSESDSPYFNVGLKMVAGSLIMLNAKPILQSVAPAIKAVADAYVANQQKIKAINGDDIIEGEYVEKQKA